jgi:hypothetical protein
LIVCESSSSVGRGKRISTRDTALAHSESMLSGNGPGRLRY